MTVSREPMVNPTTGIVFVRIHMNQRGKSLASQTLLGHPISHTLPAALALTIIPPPLLQCSLNFWCYCAGGVLDGIGYHTLSSSLHLDLL